MLRVHEKASAKAGAAEPKSIKEAYDRLPDKGKCSTDGKIANIYKKEAIESEDMR